MSNLTQVISGTILRVRRPKPTVSTRSRANHTRLSSLIGKECKDKYSAAIPNALKLILFPRTVAPFVTALQFIMFASLFGLKVLCIIFMVHDMHTRRRSTINTHTVTENQMHSRNTNSSSKIS